MEIYVCGYENYVFIQEIWWNEVIFSFLVEWGSSYDSEKV